MIRSFRYAASALLMLVAISSFAQKPTTPLALNNYFASINDSLYAKGRAWGSKLNTVRTSKDFSQLIPFRQKLETFIDQKQKELKEMKDISGSETFRKAMLSFLDYESRMIKMGFMPLEKYNTSSSTEEIKAAIDKLVEMAADESKQLEKINAAQLEYAQKNGFTIEGKKDE